MKNRRNLYRLLHVQPEAPLEIIKASYRSLMTKLKGHPDLGGDHDTAVLINQAYAVLSNPEKRRQYDETLQARKRASPAPGTRDAARASHVATSARGTARYHANREEYAAGAQRCPFCGTAVIIARRCIHCESPLTPVSELASVQLGELFGRRAAPRITKVGNLLLYPSWPHAGHTARLRDLSPTGISLHTAYAARSTQILKIDSGILKGIARVVSIRANGAVFAVHASFLTAEFALNAGGFVSEKV